MPLVKQAGRSSTDPYVSILDDAPIPDEGAVLVPAARLLADAGELAQRAGQTGVLWPNDRDVAELAPHLDRLAMVALAFPTLQGRPRLQPGAHFARALPLRRRTARDRPNPARPIPVPLSRRL